MKIIKTDTAPSPLGHYSQAIVENGWVFVSGQLGIDINQPDLIPNNIITQTEITLKNLEANNKPIGCLNEGSRFDFL